MVEVSGYTMDLYCDDPKHDDLAYAIRGVETFTAETNGQCKKSARRRGWKFKNDRTVICPICNGNRTEEQELAAYYRRHNEVTQLMKGKP